MSTEEIVALHEHYFPPHLAHHHHRFSRVRSGHYRMRHRRKRQISGGDGLLLTGFAFLAMLIAIWVGYNVLVWMATPPPPGYPPVPHYRVH